MPVQSTKEYVGISRDHISNYGDKQLVYICWMHHMLFAAPFITCVEPDMNFGDYVDNVMKPLLSPDPDAAAIDWSQVEWSKRDEAWQPDFDLSLKENGIDHKDLLKFQTPGLSTLVPLM